MILDEIIVLTNCDEAVDAMQSVIKLMSNSSIPLTCAWTIFAPTGSEITIDVTEPFDKSTLEFLNGIGLAIDESPTRSLTSSNTFETSHLRVHDNILRIQYSSKSAGKETSLIIHYKTTGIQ